MRNLGFTLIELIMVLLIASIMAVFSMAKVGVFSGWSEAGVAKELAFLVHSSQNLAVTNHRTIFMIITSMNVMACYDAACVKPASNYDGSILSLAAPSGSFTATAGGFSFDTLGRPSFSAVFTIGFGSETVSIEPETGLIW